MKKPDRLIYLALGGAGEIGMNAYVYGYGPKGKERFILVDLGIAFPDMDSTPGVDVILPDMSWLAEQADRLDGIFITHAHEDHVGGVAHMYRHFNAPIYARPFTANIAKRKMIEQGHAPENVHVVEAMEPVEVGPFTVSYLPISHSVPESAGLVIDSPEGRVIHTGDFKLDESPVVGEAFDPDLWAEVSKPGVRALVIDSTNVFTGHAGRSEAVLGPEIQKLIKAQKGMVVATTFASNIARLKTLADAGRDAGRSIVLLGRAMRRMTEAAMEEGILTDFPSVISPEDAKNVPRENLMLIVTGSQGERRAASAQLSRGKYLGLELKEGDTFLSSSKTIPGNERGVAQIMNNFSEMGVDVVTDADGLYHVSGHANRPDLERITGIVNPQVVIPMHGEHRHLRTHSKLATANGRQGVLAPNGTIVDLSGNAATVAGYVDTGRVYLDGAAHVGSYDGVVRDRLKMALNGHVVVAVMVDEDDELLEDAWVDIRGLSEVGINGAPLLDLLEDELAQALARVDGRTAADDDKLSDVVKRAVRQLCKEQIGKKPEVTTLITRLAAE